MWWEAFGKIEKENERASQTFENDPSECGTESNERVREEVGVHLGCFSTPGGRGSGSDRIAVAAVETSGWILDKLWRQSCLDLLLNEMCGVRERGELRMIPKFCPEHLSGIIDWDGNTGWVSGFQTRSSFGHKLDVPFRWPKWGCQVRFEHMILELSHDLVSCDLKEGRSQKRKRS